MQSSGLEALWPSNAAVLATLILAGRNRRDIAAIVLGGAIGSIALHMLYRDPASLTLWLTAANMLESGLAFAFLRIAGIRGGLIDRVDNYFRLTIAAGAASLFSSTIGAIGLRIARDLPFWVGWRSWYISGLLSAVLVTPAVMVAVGLVRDHRTQRPRPRLVLEFFSLSSLVAIAGAYVFLNPRLPLTFLIPPAVLLLTFRFRAVGAVAGVAIVTTIAATATAAGFGPIIVLEKAGDQVLLLQGFIAMNLLTALPVAAILNERDRQAEESRAFAEHFRSVVENIGEVIFRIDGFGRWAYLNPAWEGLTGRTVDGSLGRSWLELIESSARAELAERADEVLRGEESSTSRSVRLETQSGLRWVEVFVQGLRDQDGHIAGATGTLRDIDDRKRLEEHVLTAKRRAEQRAREATLLASTDELTGIANRRAFMGQLEREIAGAAEFGWPLAVAMFDVDYFKRVNDRYGHAVGDRVLQLIAARAASVVRGGDLVGRLGGEEFGILMPGATLDEAAQVAERLREAMEIVSEVDDALPGVTISIGIAARETDGSAAQLLAAADAALYAAKDEGRNRVRIAA